MRWNETSVEGKAGLELRTDSLRIGVVTECGPRVAWLSRPKGTNLLFWDRKGIARDDWKLMGGHRVWIARPDADESEDAYRPDNGACDVDVRGATATVTGAADPVLKVRRGLRLTAREDGAVEVEGFLTNVGDMLFSGGVWNLTCTDPAPGRTYGIPLGDGSEWDCFPLIMFRRWGGGHTSAFDDPQISFTPDMMIVRPQGRETKRMLLAPRGILAMHAPDQKTTFVKRVATDRAARLPLGCNAAFYVGTDNIQVEMETMGQQATLKPGETVTCTETWRLTDGAMELTPDKLLGLFNP